jgi:hypothetical protein
LKDVAMAALERCIRRLVLTVRKNVKFRSSRQKGSQSTAENATRSIEDTRKTDP